MEFRAGAGARDLAADAKAYDTWFRARILEALDDDRPAVSHDRVMDEARALIDRKRRAPVLNGGIPTP